MARVQRQRLCSKLTRVVTLRDCVLPLASASRLELQVTAGLGASPKLVVDVTSHTFLTTPGLRSRMAAGISNMNDLVVLQTTQVRGRLNP